MPLSLPNLDNRRYADLVEEARATIPTYAPEWTNHNPSDPGITLIELFAWLTEMLTYRLNRVTDANMLAFLKLLNEPGWTPPHGSSLAENVRDTVLALRRPYRAVTCADFERLALEADPFVARARCVPRRNLEWEDPARRAATAPGHVSIVLVPGSGPQPTPQSLATVREHLEPRRLVTTQLHVVGPRYFPVGMRFTLVLLPDTLALREEDVRAPIEQALTRFFDPLAGGPEKTGWPFGRNVFLSEIYELLDRQPGVDYVTRSLDPNTSQELEELTATDPARLLRNARGELVAVAIEADELVEPLIQLALKKPLA